MGKGKKGRGLRVMADGLAYRTIGTALYVQIGASPCDSRLSLERMKRWFHCVLRSSSLTEVS